MSDIVINKVQSIQRCVERAREEYHADPAGFATNFTRQDAAVLNVLRACEQAIDPASHIIRTRKMGIPASSAQSFELLQQKIWNRSAFGGKPHQDDPFSQHGDSPIPADGYADRSKGYHFGPERFDPIWGSHP